MKTRYYAVSFNPNYYNLGKIETMTIQEAKDFFEEEYKKEEIYFTEHTGNIDECDNLSSWEGDAFVIWFC